MGVIKTFNGLAKASVKTHNGLAIASVKSWNGMDAVDGGGGFNPLDLSPEFWFKASHLAQADNTDIASIVDSSGNANDFPVVSSYYAKYRTGVTAFGSQPVARFAARSWYERTYWSSDPFILSTTHSIYMVFLPDTATPDYGAVFSQNTSKGWYFRGGLDKLHDYSIVLSPVLSLTVPSIAVQTDNYMRLNGVNITAHSARTFNAQSIGSDTGAENFIGDIAEILVFPSFLSSTDRDAVEDYLAAEYGLTI